ncbi:sensor histidine kinase [Halobaculum rubrum]|uniref:sensor histidine kinase n=1 Tax=Halobaculum rubrum TaxID=2872158 RepID=UPI001CA3A12D|nr:PAS domain-containing sensor histidine kinase [Halobaculum rubrum]QZX99618.1 PAS domain-containing sensor histidine kinase [Halobaculum rubrum]
MTWQSGRLLLVVLAGGLLGVLAAGLVSDRLRGLPRKAVAAALASVGAWASAAAVRYGDDGSERSRAAAASVAVDAATEGVIVVDGDGAVVACNPAAADALGCTRESAVGGPISAVDSDLAALIDDSIADSGRSAAVNASEPARLLTEDAVGGTGAAGTAEASGAARRRTHLTDATGEGNLHYEVHVSSFDRPELHGRVITLRDVTDRHRLRRRIGVLNRLLRHDLRNEMNVVLGYVERIDERLREQAGQGDPSGEDGVAVALDRITGAAETMLDRAETVRHIEATLDVEESAQTRLDVVGLVRAQVDGLELAYRSVEPQVTVDAPDAAWITTTGLVDTVFDNLLENAVEHSHRERPTIEITVTESADRVAVTVADDGPGIPSQELRTFRTEAETAVTHSSGLGLWLVVWITEASGGRVSFDVDETGTAVTVEFPAADPPE